MRHFTAFDLQRHIGEVQQAALIAPVAITHHGAPRLAVMAYDRWLARGHGDALADAIRALQSNRNILRREGILRISIFGSVARGDARDDSDIDLLIEPLADVTVGGLALAHWQTLLTGLLGRKADVVVAEFLKEQVRERIDAERIEAVCTSRASGGDAA